MKFLDPTSPVHLRELEGSGGEQEKEKCLWGEEEEEGGRGGLIEWSACNEGIEKEKKIEVSRARTPPRATNTYTHTTRTDMDTHTHIPTTYTHMDTSKPGGSGSGGGKFSKFLQKNPNFSDFRSLPKCAL